MRASHAGRGYSLAARWLAATAVGLATAQALSIGASLLRIVFSVPVAGAIIVASLALGAAYFRRLREGGRRPGRSPAFAKVLGIGTVLISVAIYVLTWVAALAKPDLSWDGNSYHIPMLNHWARRGYIHWIGFDYDIGSDAGWFVHWLLNGYPKGAETISFLVIRATASSAAVNTNNLLFLPLGVLGIVATARTLGASRWSALAAGCAFALVPIVLSQACTTYVDSSFASGVAALCGCVAVTLERGNTEQLPREWAPAVGATIGLAASAKSSGVAPAGLSLLVITLLVGLRIRNADRGERRETAAQGAAFLGLVGLVAALVSAYWYARSWVYTGNPLSPVRVAVLGHEVFPGVPVAEAISEAGITPTYMTTWPGWKRIAFTWAQGAKWPVQTNMLDGGIGYLWLLGCVPATVYVAAMLARETVAGRRTARMAIFGAILFIVGVSFAVTPMNWWSRYTMWIYAAGLPCLALTIDRAARAKRVAVSVVSRAWLVGVFVIAAYEGQLQFQRDALSPGFCVPPPPVDGLRSFGEALTHYNHPKQFYRNLSALDVEAVTSDEAVAIGPMKIGGGPLMGQFSMPVGLREIVFVSGDMGRDYDALRALCEKHNVRYLFWRDDELTPEPVLRLSHRADRTEGYWRTFDVGISNPGARHDVRAK